MSNNGFGHAVSNRRCYRLLTRPASTDPAPKICGSRIRFEPRELLEPLLAALAGWLSAPVVARSTFSFGLPTSS